MNKQVEKIKKELERRIREDYNGNEYQDEIAQGVCASMLYYINYLEEEPVSEDLEEAAKEYADKRLSIINPEISKSSYSRHTKMALPLFDGCELESAFEEGANWQKEHMLKDAFDAEVGYWNIRGLSLNVRLKGDIEDGDRVKLIMIKEE